jgi:hypothetical protein
MGAARNDRKPETIHKVTNHFDPLTTPIKGETSNAGIRFEVK